MVVVKVVLNKRSSSGMISLSILLYTIFGRRLLSVGFNPQHTQPQNSTSSSLCIPSCGPSNDQPGRLFNAAEVLVVWYPYYSNQGLQFYLILPFPQ